MSSTVFNSNIPAQFILFCYRAHVKNPSNSETACAIYALS